MNRQVSNKRYSNSKKTLEQIVKELEFRNFELERTLDSVLQLISLAKKPHDLASVDLRENYGKDWDEISKWYNLNKEKTTTPPLTPKPVEEKPKAVVAQPTSTKPPISHVDELKQRQAEGKLKPSQIKKEQQEAKDNELEQLTPEDKEAQRKRRMADALKASQDLEMEEMKKKVLADTMEQAKAQKDIGGEVLACRTCGKQDETVGFSERLQKSYCPKCLQRVIMGI